MTEIAMEDCIKSEREGEEWKKMIERRNWRLLTENVIRKREKKNGKGIHRLIFLNMNGIHIQENKHYKMQFNPSLVIGQLLF